MINIFSVYLGLLTCFNVYNLLQNISVLIRFYRKFEQLPQWLQKVARGILRDGIEEFTAEHLPDLRKDIVINCVLLMIVLMLNGFLWYLRLSLWFG